MPPDLPSVANLDYLHRLFDPEPLSKRTPARGIVAADRRLLHITGVGRVQKDESWGARGQDAESKRRDRLDTEPLLAGAHGLGIPLAFVVRGAHGKTTIELGTWSATGGPKRTPAASGLDLVERLLASIYPAVDHELGQNDWPDLDQGGFALGIPSIPWSSPHDQRLPADRIINALTGPSWCYLILAEPIDPDEISDLRNALMNEMRSFQSGNQGVGGVNPLTEQYAEVSKFALRNLTLSHSIGAWRTTAYLVGDADGYLRLRALWPSVYAGDESLPEAIRVIDAKDAAQLAGAWAIPDVACTAKPPGYFRHPYEYQTVLNSRQLAAYIHLPHEETNGFTVKQTPRFDVVPQRSGAGSREVMLGSVIERGRISDQDYYLDIDSLTRHAFVAGVTGAGKTTTILRLLKGIPSNTPFLVIEPAKREYQVLLEEAAFAKQLKLFTPGDETCSPLRLNPFEPVGDTPVAVHIDLMRSVFTASFGMWTPLPQVLEQCLHAIYKDRGWDIATDDNVRLGGDARSPESFPTMADLAAKVEELVPQLGYEDKVESDIRAALLTRITGLRMGGKGRMLDTDRSLPASYLFENPVVLQLDGMGDDDDKAFMMGLILIRLVEYQRASGEQKTLKHLLVVEEAHRLLANVGGPKREEESDARGKAVESFANLLAEVRAYGQGILVADQIPVKLAPEIIKNSGLKIAHQIVADDDREALGRTMNMNDLQKSSLATLEPGAAAIFRTRDDAPVLIKVRDSQGVGASKDGKSTETLTRLAIHDFMKAAMRVDGQESLLRPLECCARVCPATTSACYAAQGIVESPSFRKTLARVVLSGMEDPESIYRLWPDILSIVESKRPFAENDVSGAHGLDGPELFRCVAIRGARWFAQRRGAQLGWKYSQTTKIEEALRKVLMSACVRDSTLHVSQEDLLTARSFQETARDLHKRTFDPFAGCGRICKQEPRVCLYRYPVADLISSGGYDAAWGDADANDAGGTPENKWKVSTEAAFESIEFPSREAGEDPSDVLGNACRRVAQCFSQQMLDRDSNNTPWDTRVKTDALIALVHIE